MKKLILFFLLISSFGAMAQNQDAQPYGGIYYGDHSNQRFYGAFGIPRTDHTNIDTLTNVLKGDLRFDTLNSVVVVYNGTAWVDLAWSYSNSAIIRQASLTIATADVLTLNATPIEIVAAPGAGFAIEVISATFKSTFNSVSYATNIDIDIRTIGSSVNLTTNVAKLGFTANTINLFALKADPAADQIIENTGIEVFVETGDPTAGNSDIKVYVTYRIITL